MTDTYELLPILVLKDLCGSYFHSAALSGGVSVWEGRSGRGGGGTGDLPTISILLIN